MFFFLPIRLCTFYFVSLVPLHPLFLEAGADQGKRCPQPQKGGAVHFVPEGRQFSFSLAEV